MALPTGPPSASTSIIGARPHRTRWPYAGPDQLPLLLASLAVAVGSFLPWVMVGGLSMSGGHGPGLWTFYAASLGLAGALIRHRRLAVASATAAGSVAVGIAVWQVLHLVGRIGFQGWHPGVGLVIVLLGGIIALRSAWRLADLQLTTGRTS